MIDTSKIRPGDAGTIRVRFESTCVDSLVDIIIEGVSRGHAIPAIVIASHTPAPRGPEKRDVVEMDTSPLEWEVRFVDEDGFVSLRRPVSVPSEWSTRSFNRDFAHISRLRLIRKGAV